MQTDLTSDTNVSGPGVLGRALCIITGASKGFGRSLAIQISCLLKPRSVLLLVARSEDKLREVQVDLNASDAHQGDCDVRLVVADLGCKKGIEETVKAAKETSTTDIEHLLLINNAGSLGDVSRFATSFTDLGEVDSYLSFNVGSVLSLTAGILSAFPQRPGLRRTVVNVSSKCAVDPFRSWVLYCTGKAARDMMFRVLAEEESDLRVLNYAPGPLDTDMQAVARSNSADPELKKLLTVMHSQGQLVTCMESGDKLIKVLLEDSYQSGAHLDFYDL